MGGMPASAPLRAAPRWSSGRGGVRALLWSAAVVGWALTAHLGVAGHEGSVSPGAVVWSLAAVALLTGVGAHALAHRSATGRALGWTVLLTAGQLLTHAAFAVSHVLATASPIPGRTTGGPGHGAHHGGTAASAAPDPARWVEALGAGGAPMLLAHLGAAAAAGLTVVLLESLLTRAVHWWRRLLATPSPALPHRRTVPLRSWTPSTTLTPCSWFGRAPPAFR